MNNFCFLSLSDNNTIASIKKVCKEPLNHIATSRIDWFIDY